MILTFTDPKFLGFFPSNCPFFDKINWLWVRSNMFYGLCKTEGGREWTKIWPHQDQLFNVRKTYPGVFSYHHLHFIIHEQCPLISFLEVKTRIVNSIFSMSVFHCISRLRLILRNTWPLKLQVNVLKNCKRHPATKVIIFSKMMSTLVKLYIVSWSMLFMFTPSSLKIRPMV